MQCSMAQGNKHPRPPTPHLVVARLDGICQTTLTTACKDADERGSGIAPLSSHALI